MRKTPLIEQTPRALVQRTGERAKARRLALGLTREILAERAGVSVDTLRRFETTGQIAFERLVRISVALNSSPNLDDLFPVDAVERLEDLERAAPARQRGVRRDASAAVRAKLVRIGLRGSASPPPK
jgi:transcriptional regulator with XRE-family HTH domain